MPRFKKNNPRHRGKKFYGPNKKIKKLQPADFDRKKKNAKFIKRSKEAEEAQRRQKLVEDKYRSKSTESVEEFDDSMSETEEHVNPFDQLVAGFRQNNEENGKYKVIDSSDDETDDQQADSDEEDEEMEAEEMSEESDASIDEEIEDIEDQKDESEEGEEEASGDEFEDDMSDNSGEDSNDENDNNDVEDESLAADEKEQQIEEEELDEETERIETNTKSKSNDLFSLHLDHDISSDLLESLAAKPPVIRKDRLEWPILGNLQIEIPTTNKTSKPGKKNSQPRSNKKSLLDEVDVFATEGELPTLLSHKTFDFDKCNVKSQLQSNFSFANSANASTHIITPLQAELFSVMNNYQDLFYPNRTLQNGEEIRLLYSLHALNHMLKTRTKILHHNAKLTAAASSNKENAIIPDTYRDQGLVRPKVLILLPFRDSAYRVVNMFVKLLFGEKEEHAKTSGGVINYKRFEEEFTGDSIRFPTHNPKPEDYEKTFAGNTDDTFRIGISFTKKCIKLYTEFYSSDILIASPLGLRMIIGAPGEAERDFDFLASIELLILDQAELFLAQNWDHLLHVFDHLHLQPQSVRSTDFSRVRSWSLNGWARFYRQTLLFTSHELPEFRSLFNSRCANYRGKVRAANPIIDGSIRHVITQIPQVFHKIDVSSIESSFDVRFKYFINEILPQFTGPSMAHCMIYVPSYFDFVRLRNHFKTETMNFVQICEYTKDAKIARARDMFFHSAAHFLLYSERAHFFRRTRIKGIRHLIMYQPPFWPHLYSEMVNLMQDSNQNPRDGLESSMSVTILYTKYDMLQASAIIGTERAAKMFKSPKTTCMFMTGD